MQEKQPRSMEAVIRTAQARLARKMDSLGSPSRWEDRMLCSELSPQEADYFHSEDPVEKKLAKMVCHACGVKEPCLESALTNQYEDGIYGGLDADERQDILDADSNRERSMRVQQRIAYRILRKKNLGY